MKLKIITLGVGSLVLQLSLPACCDIKYGSLVLNTEAEKSGIYTRSLVLSVHSLFNIYNGLPVLNICLTIHVKDMQMLGNLELCRSLLLIMHVSTNLINQMKLQGF